jgi:lipopolysaccharide export system permease protein
MDLLGRYIFRQTVSALVMILITLTIIVWVATAIKYLSILTQGQGVFIFTMITMLSMPKLVAFVAPIALLVASIHTLNRLSSDSELIIISASGGTIWRIIKPYFMLSAIVAAYVFASNAYLQPLTARMLRVYVLDMRSDVFSQMLQPGVFSNMMDKGLTVHIRERSPEGELLGLMVHDERNSKEIMTYIAERARFVKQEGDPNDKSDDQAFLMMENGHVQRLDGKTGDVNILTFDSYLFDLSEMGPKKGVYQYKSDERYLTELIWPDSNDESVKTIAGKMRADLHDRIANPLYAILFVLTAVIYLGQAQTTREGRTDYVVGAFFVGSVARAGGFAGQSMLVKQSWAISIVYGIPVIGISVVLLMAWFNLRPVILSFGSLKLPRLRFLGRAATNRMGATR